MRCPYRPVFVQSRLLARHLVHNAQWKEFILTYHQEELVARDLRHTAFVAALLLQKCVWVLDAQLFNRVNQRLCDRLLIARFITEQSEKNCHALGYVIRGALSAAVLPFECIQNLFRTLLARHCSGKLSHSDGYSLKRG